MAKVVAVADTFDAMTTDRPYQLARKFEDAIERIQAFVDIRYDSTVVAAFVEACEEGQIRAGSVKLKSRTAPGVKTTAPSVDAGERESVAVS
jgi:HD-GYP domain-containing protein (c-di-GMP phosphodiesterase class II)